MSLVLDFAEHTLADVGNSRFIALTKSIPRTSKDLTVSGASVPFSIPEKLQEAEDGQPISEVRELPKHGHCKLSKFMAAHPEVGIFNRFSDLNTYNLLALQSELCYLRHEYHEAVKDGYAASKADSKAHLDCNLRHLSQSDSEQWNILLQIREKLNEYNTALRQQVELQSQPRPTKHNLNILQHFLASEHGCHNELRGIDSTIWDVEGDTRDFLSLSNKHARRDLFSRWIGDTFLKWWHERIRSPYLHQNKKPVDEENSFGFTEYDDTKLSARVHVLATFLSSLLVTGPMFALYFIQDMVLRLWIVMVFTTIFSLCMAIFSKARRGEIFAATAAFAAVQVVFVGSVTN